MDCGAASCAIQKRIEFGNNIYCLAEMSRLESIRKRKRERDVNIRRYNQYDYGRRVSVFVIVRCQFLLQAKVTALAGTQICFVSFVFAPCFFCPGLICDIVVCK